MIGRSHHEAIGPSGSSDAAAPIETGVGSLLMPFKFSKNIFNNSENQYAHYIFNKGFGTISKKGFYVFDYISKKPIVINGGDALRLDSLGKAITQDSFQDFLDRK